MKLKLGEKAKKLRINIKGSMMMKKMKEIKDMKEMKKKGYV